MGSFIKKQSKTKAMKNVMFHIGNDNTDNILIKNKNSQELSINETKERAKIFIRLSITFDNLQLARNLNMN